MNEEPKTSWCLIPPEIWEDENLNLTEKCLLGRILALQDSKGYCYASNNYLAKQLYKSADRISKVISKLVEMQYLSRSIIRDDGGKIVVRYLRVLGGVWLKTTIPMVENNYRGIVENDQDRIDILDKILDKNTLQDAKASLGINHLIELFKPINPSYKRLFPNKTQRSALERMVGEHTYEKVELMLKSLPEVTSRPYAPKITTPLQFEQKLGELVVFTKQERNKNVGTNKFAKIS